ncbi:MAG: hypothetical protein BMS9Abin36_2091 [Gammaproteobacteria bacterium]|nr:MAG: hypothetical protein BMS9Abin36_2091 [Gammaproteobacteria bacterium]
MAISSTRTEVKRFYGLSTDTKPTQNVEPFSLFLETDTGIVFRYSGTTWYVTNSIG